jgi:hypothetical protein
MFKRSAQQKNELHLLRKLLKHGCSNFIETSVGAFKLFIHLFHIENGCCIYAII